MEERIVLGVDNTTHCFEQQSLEVNNLCGKVVRRNGYWLGDVNANLFNIELPKPSIWLELGEEELIAFCRNHKVTALRPFVSTPQWEQFAKQNNLEYLGLPSDLATMMLRKSTFFSYVEKNLEWETLPWGIFKEGEILNKSGYYKPDQGAGSIQHQAQWEIAQQSMLWQPQVEVESSPSIQIIFLKEREYHIMVFDQYMITDEKGTGEFEGINFPSKHEEKLLTIGHQFAQQILNDFFPGTGSLSIDFYEVDGILYAADPNGREGGASPYRLYIEKLLHLEKPLPSKIIGRQWIPIDQVPQGAIPFSYETNGKVCYMDFGF